jgi:hypothetical protein
MVVEEVEYAVKIASGFDWEKAAGDHRVALLTLAQVAASVAPGMRGRCLIVTSPFEIR